MRATSRAGRVLRSVALQQKGQGEHPATIIAKLSDQNHEATNPPRGSARPITIHVLVSMEEQNTPQNPYLKSGEDTEKKKTPYRDRPHPGA